MTPVFAMHVISATEEMPSYGLSMECSDGTYVLMPTDTQHVVPPQLDVLYKKATAVYMDCETDKFASRVHPHISELIEHMHPDIQKKCYLYHYQSDPEYPPGMFKGILRTGGRSSLLRAFDLARLFQVIELIFGELRKTCATSDPV